ncbi:MAG: hypothetical protein QGI08_14865 [Paracoccaceae bacterium]|jgi:hypothetical protein|nr:hypothetical protein [Paracoccaceae bacterium]MDP7186997.1 hypothetical protein [Paracoccaceae bacterium]
MDTRAIQNRNYAATGILFTALLVMALSSIPVTKFAQFSVERAQSQTQLTEMMAVSIASGVTDQKMTAGTPDMAQFCPMAFGCTMMSSASHCAPVLLVGFLPVFDVIATIAAALGVSDAPMQPATIGFFHFRPPIL